MAGTIGVQEGAPAVGDHRFVGFRKGGRLRFTDAFVVVTQNALDVRQIDVALAAGAGGTLQTAYDGGETVTEDAQGAIDITRGELVPDLEAALTILDANANPGRTNALVLITDQNVVAAPTPGEESWATLEAVKTNTTQSTVVIRAAQTDAGAVGPAIELFHDSATPADNDEVGRVTFLGRDSGGAVDTFGFLQSIALTVVAAGETGAFDVHVPTSGVSGRLVRVQGDSNVAEPGLRITVFRTGDTGPAFRFRPSGTWTGANIVYQFEQAAGGSTLFSIVGSGAANALTAYQVAGTQVVSARGAAVADAAGGAVIDIEARAALNALLARVRVHGLIAP